MECLSWSAGLVASVDDISCAVKDTAQHGGSSIPTSSFVSGSFEAGEGGEEEKVPGSTEVSQASLCLCGKCFYLISATSELEPLDIWLLVCFSHKLLLFFEGIKRAYRDPVFQT